MTVVEVGWDGRYDQHTQNAEAVSMVNQTPDEIQRALERGDWLTSGQIATLVDRGRSTIWRRLRRGDIRWQESPGGHRAYHPVDVRRLVAELRTVHGGEQPA